jgi:hypothetical protein
VIVPMQHRSARTKKRPQWALFAVHSSVVSYSADRSPGSVAFARIGIIVSCQPVVIPCMLDQNAIHSRMGMGHSVVDPTDEITLQIR